ncbi:MAG: C-GCAxxG-C-C family protein [Bacteroidales bacterium]|jgi:C_GCAxxG_C_C family probable redox protein|nr:C-GCAxxG-C-C family protein [Bacteroidales bacterium]
MDNPMTRQEDATLYFADAFTCSQSVFTVFGKDMGLTVDQCLKIGNAFGGGMARQQFTCGAVTGALMVIGLIFGRGLNDDLTKKEFTYDKVIEFFTEFRKRNGSVNCRELLRGFNMNDPEELKQIEELELFQTSCVKYVQDAVEIVEQLIGAGNKAK